LARAEEPRDALALPDPVDAVLVGLVPELTEVHGVGRVAEQPPAPDHPLRSPTEVSLETLVGIDADDPFGLVAKRGGHERTVVPDFIPLWPVWRDAQQVEHRTVLGESLRRAIAGTVVERDDAVDLRRDVSDEPGR
jgi:hypothetical protein